MYLNVSMCISLLYCMYCMYFLPQNLLGGRYIQDTYNTYTYAHDTYRYNFNTDKIHTKYMQIHTVETVVRKSAYCMYQHVFACIIFQSICACMCLYGMYLFVCVHILMYLQYIHAHMHSSHPSSQECICVCMCMYSVMYFGMYVHCICMYCMYWPRRAPMPAQRPRKAPGWGGTRLAPLRASLGRWQTTLSRHWGHSPGPVLAHQHAQHASGGGKVHLLRRQ